MIPSLPPRPVLERIDVPKMVQELRAARKKAEYQRTQCGATLEIRIGNISKPNLCVRTSAPVTVPMDGAVPRASTSNHEENPQVHQERTTCPDKDASKLLELNQSLCDQMNQYETQLAQQTAMLRQMVAELGLRDETRVTEHEGTTPLGVEGSIAACHDNDVSKLVQLNQSLLDQMNQHEEQLAQQTSLMRQMVAELRLRDAARATEHEDATPWVPEISVDFDFGNGQEDVNECDFYSVSGFEDECEFYSVNGFEDVEECDFYSVNGFEDVQECELDFWSNKENAKCKKHSPLQEGGGQVAGSI
eukprot:GEMP01063603.1.p2 GENE.GEMP01063603.1~~GEMP01063603.1.p2  ORF type:complete len:304 (+),score=80.61 GEMP01063603.1:126-1037(+)